MEIERKGDLKKRELKIGYARVSMEDRQTLGMEEQVAALRGAGCNPVVTEEVEVGGDQDDRQEMQRAIDRAKRSRDQGWIVSFYIYQLDRLGRHTGKAIQVIEELINAGIAVVSLKEDFDTSTPTGMQQYQLLASFAEYEFNSIQQRTKDGLEQARKNGQRLGRPAVDPAIKSAVVQTYTNSKFDVKDIAGKYDLGISTVYKILQDAHVKRSSRKK